MGTGGKQPGLEADNSPSSSVEDVNELEGGGVGGSVTLLPMLYTLTACRGIC
jgi:hypothetical protein